MKITVRPNGGRADRRLEMSIGGNGLGVVRDGVKREALEHRVSEANRHINRTFSGRQNGQALARAYAEMVMRDVIKERP